MVAWLWVSAFAGFVLIGFCGCLLVCGWLRVCVVGCCVVGCGFHGFG